MRYGVGSSIYDFLSNNATSFQSLFPEAVNLAKALPSLDLNLDLGLLSQIETRRQLPSYKQVLVRGKLSIESFWRLVFYNDTSLDNVSNASGDWNIVEVGDRRFLMYDGDATIFANKIIYGGEAEVGIRIKVGSRGGGTAYRFFILTLSRDTAPTLPEDTIDEVKIPIAIPEDKITEIEAFIKDIPEDPNTCLLYTSPSPRDRTRSRMPSSA